MTQVNYCQPPAPKKTQSKPKPAPNPQPKPAQNNHSHNQTYTIHNTFNFNNYGNIYYSGGHMGVWDHPRFNNHSTNWDVGQMYRFSGGQNYNMYPPQNYWQEPTYEFAPPIYLPGPYMDKEPQSWGNDYSYPPTNFYYNDAPEYFAMPNVVYNDDRNGYSQPNYATRRFVFE